MIFISGTTAGGSGRSQRELAMRLSSKGHEILFLVDDGRSSRASRWVYSQLSDLSVRLARTPFANPASLARDAVGASTSTISLQGIRHLATAVPQNALPRLIRTFAPDLVVVNSVERWAWRRIRAVCQQFRVPTILYVREMDSLAHAPAGLPDVLLANTKSLASRLISQGFACEFIPSVVDVSVTQTTSSRQRALVINPDLKKGIDFFWQLAKLAPDIPFTLQEAWELDADDLAEIHHRVAQMPNVEFRRRIDPGPSLYSDTRVLVAPYRVDSRPRVILEAHSNGIPVLASDLPALVDAVGSGGLALSLGDPDAWAVALRRLWQDDAVYSRMAGAALAVSSRPELNPDMATSSFEVAMDRAVRGHLT